MAKKKPKKSSLLLESGWLSRTLHLYGKVHEIEVPPGPDAEAELDRACREAEEQARNEHVGAAVMHEGGRPPLSETQPGKVEAIRAELRKVRDDPWCKNLNQTQVYERVMKKVGVSRGTVKKYDPEYPPKTAG